MTTTLAEENDPVECIYQYTRPSIEGEQEPETRTHTVRGVVKSIKGSELTIKADHRKIKVDTETDHVKLISGPQPVDKDQECKVVELNKIELTTVKIDFDTHDFRENRHQYIEKNDLSAIESTTNEILTIITKDLSNKWLTDYRYISTYTALKAASISKEGIETHIEEHNRLITEPEGQITFPTKQGAVIWINEILGQLSDGIWENEDISWEHYHNLEVIINEDQQTITTTGEFESLSFTEKLFEYDGMVARMMLYAMIATETTEYSSTQVKTLTEQLDAL